MQKRIILLTFAFVCLTAVTVWAISNNYGHKETVKTELQGVATDADHCDPSACTPDKAAHCPYANGEKASAEASAHCPATADCPPSSCNAGSGDKAEL
ncbi:MAG: hypothetical protein R2794_04405 [Chitinophagales bacterium]